MNTGTIGFTTLDWAILVVYVAGSAALGSLFARGQKSSEDHPIQCASGPRFAG